MKKTRKIQNQTGRLMLEMIAFLAIMALLTPMIFMKTVDRDQELEDSIVAAQMRTLRNSITNIITNNYSAIVGGGEIGGDLDSAGNIIPGTGIAVDKLPVGTDNDNIPLNLTDAQIQMYLPEGYASTTKYLGDAFKVGINRQRVKTPDGKDRVVVSAIIIGGMPDNQEMTDKRSSRIASMIGTDGGIIKSSAWGGAGNTMVISGGGLWELDTSDYFDSKTEIGQGKVVILAPVLGPTEGDFGGRYMWRTKVDDCPECNRMATNMSMTPEGREAYAIRNIDQITAWKSYTNQYKGSALDTSQNNEGAVVSGTTLDAGTTNYGIDLSGTRNSVMADIHLGSLNGNLISDLIPPMSLRKILRNVTNGTTVGAPGYSDYNANPAEKATTEKIDRKCPVGYAPVIYVAPRISSDVATGNTVSSSVTRKGSNSLTTGWTITLNPSTGTVADAYIYCKFVPGAFVAGSMTPDEND